MPTSFGFSYEVILFTPDKVNNYIIPQTLVSPEKVSQGTNGLSPDGIVLKSKDYLDFNTTSGKQYSINSYKGRGLQVKFEVNQSKEKGVPCNLTLFNLPPDIVDALEVDMSVIIRAGYRTQLSGDFIETSVGEGQSSLPDLFVGQIVAHTTTNNDVDVITDIICGEGVVVSRNSRVSKTFPKDTTRKGVIDGLLSYLKEHGVPLGKFTLPSSGSREERILNSPYLTGYSCYGYLMEELDKVCKAVNLRTFMVSGRLYIEPVSTTIESIPLAPSITTRPQSAGVFTVAPSNVKGQVELSDASGSNTPSNSNGKKKLSKLSLTTYLNGQISVDKVMKLSGFSYDLDGEYKITSVGHVGDYSGGVWETRVTLEALA